MAIRTKPTNPNRATHTTSKRSARPPMPRPPRLGSIPTFDGEAALPDDPTIRVFYHQVHRSDGGVAFVPDPEDGTPIVADDAESFAEEFIATATAGEGVEMDAIDEVVDEEDGGPFLEIESEADIREAAGIQEALVEALGPGVDDVEPPAPAKRPPRRARA